MVRLIVVESGRGEALSDSAETRVHMKKSGNYVDNIKEVVEVDRITSLQSSDYAVTLFNLVCDSCALNFSLNERGVLWCDSKLHYEQRCWFYPFGSK